MDDNKNAPVGANFNVDPFRTPVLYADSVYIKANDYGMVLDIAQQIGDSPQFSIVARVGLSKDHVRRLIEHLEALLKTEGMRSTKKES